ncbi:MAG: YcxB family protein [Candidatus Viridilinea halotolerans]|uniref:YcxB family protein n=1 Tax=Candidatus Viridilinea halotolerans TaxID=2491704 RepID=A0A426TV69_9CHLR|nr:MAG: YcxB family protein [Candidatus Viridilinea halotolerans]
MMIESSLTRQEFVRYSLKRHFTRLTFYLYASVCAVIAAFTYFNPQVSRLLYLAAVLPVLAYSIGGWLAVLRRSRDEHLPVYLPIRYTFSKNGVEVSSRLGRSVVPWSDIKGWEKLLEVYELALQNGQVLVIAQRALAARQLSEFEELLRKHVPLGPKGR